MFCSMGGGYCRSNQGGTNCWNHGIMFRGNGETERKSGGREDNRQRRVKERNISPSYFSYCSFWVSVFSYSFWVLLSSFLVGAGGGGATIQEEIFLGQSRFRGSPPICISLGATLLNCQKCLLWQREASALVCCPSDQLRFVIPTFS